MVRQILLGGAVSGAVMSILLLLSPEGPIYTALALAIGMTAGNLTWRPVNLPVPKHIAGCAAGGAVAFAITYAIQSVAGPFFG